MPSKIKRVHYYHADATALGGVIDAPIRHTIPAQAPLSLAPVGGHDHAVVENYKLDGILSFKRAYTRVAGGKSEKNNGATTVVTSVVEDLNIQEIITADRVVAHIMGEHPEDGYEPKVTFVGTRFDNLRIGGYPVQVVLDLDLCSWGDPETYPTKPTIENPDFLNKVSEHYRKMNDSKSAAAWMKDRNIPGWVKERHQWDNSMTAKLGMVPCSLVKEIRGEFPGRVFGHALEIGEFGKIFLAELLVDRNSYRLIMMRLEFGCSTSGKGSVASANFEGRTAP
jgi:hypothetical protein